MKQYFSLQFWKGQRLLLLAFLLVHVVIASVHISYQDITFDEPDYYTYAAKWLHGNVDRTDKMYDSKTPVVAVALIPRIFRQLVQPGYKATDSGVADVKQGRYFMVIWTIIIAIYLFVWTRKLFGPRAWIIPMLFFLFDPMVISFSMIITSDMASGACLIAAMFHLYMFYRNRRRKDLFIFSVWLGTGFVCKASLLFMLPCLAILYIILLLAGKIKFNLKKLAVYTIIVSVIALLVINLAYFGKESFHSLGRIPVTSGLFRSVAANPVISKIPVPLPENYVVALDLLQYHKEIGAGNPESSYPGVFVNGITRHHSGFWYYYLYVGFYKIPISILVLLLAGIMISVVQFRRKAFFERYLWFAWPAAFFFIVLSCFNSFQLGLRHLLLVYPLFFTGIAALIFYCRKRTRYILPVSLALFVFMIVSTGIYFPHLMAYTNEFLTDKKNVFRKIKDGSIDYGQNKKELGLYLLQHPGTRRPGSVPAPGRYIVRAMELFDEGPGSSARQYTWLLNFQPIAHYKYSMFIFDISEKDIEALKQKSRP